MKKKMPGDWYSYGVKESFDEWLVIEYLLGGYNDIVRAYKRKYDAERLAKKLNIKAQKEALKFNVSKHLQED